MRIKPARVFIHGGNGWSGGVLREMWVSLKDGSLRYASFSRRSHGGHLFIKRDKVTGTIQPISGTALLMKLNESHKGHSKFVSELWHQCCSAIDVQMVLQGALVDCSLGRIQS
jgi:hypothetical protein